jgi:hypothetical protein
MSEVLRLPEGECTRAHALLAGFVDGELTPAQSEWLGGHLDGCRECRAALDAFAEIDCELTGWGKRTELKNPPPADARLQLAARMGSRPARRWPNRWVQALAAFAAAAALTAIAVTVTRGKPPDAGREPAQFIGIPYLPPLDPRENTGIVRTNIRVSMLIAAGYRVTADPDSIVPAEVLVGEDGRAHAVRVSSDIHLN